MTDRAKQLQGLIEGFHMLKRTIDPRGYLAAKNRPLTMTQWIVLGMIARKGSVSIKDIKETLQVSSSAATQIVNELIKSGRVEKRAAIKDARVMLVTLSPKTQKALAQLRQAMVRRLTKLFSVLNDREFAQYMLLHEKIMRAAGTVIE